MFNWIATVCVGRANPNISIQSLLLKPILFLFFPGYKSIQDWVITTRWDSEIIHIALKAMSYINEYKIFVIYVLITNSVIHAMCGLNLIIGGCLSPTSKQRLLFLPWLTLDMIYIVLTTVLFVCWAFLSFFVHILVAIFSPVISGAFLGFWIYAWRNVREHFIICGQRGRDELDLVKYNQQKSYRKLPPASQSPTAEMRIVPHYQHQVPVWCGITFIIVTKKFCEK